MREFRERHGLTQLQLAYELKVTPGAISKWEREQPRPPRWLELALKGLEIELIERGEK